MKNLRSVLVPVLAFVLLLAAAGTVAAQAGAGAMASQTLGRGYVHVFIAYAVAWLLVLGWTVSIARRLARVERRLEE